MSSDILSSIRDLFGSEARDAKVMARVAEEKRQRLAAMAADPVRRRYVERIERGEHWHDEDITFNEHPPRRASANTCGPSNSCCEPIALICGRPVVCALPPTVWSISTKSECR